uniref:Cytochrome c oxidase subunit 5A, mitochondrial n=1 Tax=Sciurus vulgaris TaxID=55149 RepID=A0A8D2B884_SCIVU
MWFSFILLVRCIALVSGRSPLPVGGHSNPGQPLRLHTTYSPSPKATIHSLANFDAYWMMYFNKQTEMPDTNAWELCKRLNSLVGYDLVSEPKIIDNSLWACSWLNDFPDTVCILEIVKDKTGRHKEIYSCLNQELGPTVNELLISPLEELCFWYYYLIVKHHLQMLVITYYLI